MSSLPEKVKRVERIFGRLDKELADFQKSTGLHCLAGCGECCKKPDIEATPLEFLPLALHYYDQGIAEKILDELQSSKDPLCHAFRSHVTNFGGLCVQYPHRGLICRLFGFSARRTKENKPELVTCKLIKKEQEHNYLQAMKDIANGKKVVTMSDYYSRLASVDHTLVDFYPINQAVARALEIVLHYYAYRRRRKPKQNNGELL